MSEDLKQPVIWTQELRMGRDPIHLKFFQQKVFLAVFTYTVSSINAEEVCFIQPPSSFKGNDEAWWAFEVSQKFHL